ncbi:hypothetical protein LXL04_032502 [Taraxacum kok-saghyz]
MAGVTHSQLMAKFDVVNKRMDGQDETLKSIQSSLVELASAVKALVTTQDKSKVKGYESDAPHNIDVEESDGQLHEDGESSSATKGKNGYITQLSKTEYEEKRMKNECLYCRQKYTQGHKCRLSKLLMLICPDAEDGKIDNGDSTVMEESDHGDKMSLFTPNPKPDEDIDLKEESLFPPVNDFASGVENMMQMPTSNPFVFGISDSWRKQTNVGHRSDRKRKAKVVFDESFGSSSGKQKDDSSLTGEFSSLKISSVTPKPDLNPLPSVKTASYGKGNLKPLPDTSQRGDNVSKQPIFDYDSSYMFPVPSKSQQSQADKETQIGDNGGKQKGGMPRFDICPKKVNTGGIRLKPSLHTKNKEKWNQMKLAAQGPIIKILRPGMVIMKDYIASDDQVKIVKTCRELGIGDGGFYQPRYHNGAKLHLKMMCLGRNWDPQSRQYVDTRPIDNSKPPKIPDYFLDMVKRAILDSNLHIQKNKGKTIPSMLPDIGFVNFYTKDGKLGLHQDKDESRESLSRGLPVVLFSIGDSAEFLYGDERDIEKSEKVILESGDVLIFGGESRHIFHGVPSIDPDSAPKKLLEVTDMCQGHLNLIFKQY